jgi:sugar lactone lactonase YvrE
MKTIFWFKKIRPAAYGLIAGAGFWFGEVSLLPSLAGPGTGPASYAFTTLAGDIPAATGSAGGLMKFSHPWGLTADAAGNLYVANTRDQTIWRITPAGVATLFAGKSGCPGSADGTGGNARFGNPHGLAMDRQGNLYVADSSNDTIRKVTPVGAVTTLAGWARHVGSADGAGAAARFNYPNGVTVDEEGNVYVTDLYNATLRKVTPAGVVTTLAGLAGHTGCADGIRSVASFDSPFGVAVDSGGNVYVSDLLNNAIRKVTPTGLVTTWAGRLSYEVGHRDGPGAAARFGHPGGLVIDGADNLYVTDTDNDTIRKITPAGVVTTIAGQAGHIGNADGAGTVAQFWHPVNLALDGAGDLYVMDLDNARIRKGVPAGAVALTNFITGARRYPSGDLGLKPLGM